MRKIASPSELQAELRSIMTFIHSSEKPDRQVVAAKLRDLADRVASGGPDPSGRGWVSRGDRMLWDSREDEIFFTVRPVAAGGFGLGMLYDGEPYSWKGNFPSQEDAFEAAAGLYQKLTRTHEADKYLNMMRKL